MRSSVRLSPKAWGVGLALAGVVLSALSLAVHYSRLEFGHDYVFGMVRLFDTDLEANVPTWYSSALLLGIAILLFAVYRVRRPEGDRFARHWGFLAALFLFMSADEAAAIHELLIEPVRRVIGVRGFLQWAWVVPGMALVAVLGVAYARFVLALPRRTALLFLGAGLLYLTGALGMEMVGGHYWSTWWTGRDLGYGKLTTIEELLEMEGLALFAYALLDYMRSHSVELRVAAGGSGAGRES